MRLARTSTSARLQSITNHLRSPSTGLYRQRSFFTTKMPASTQKALLVTEVGKPITLTETRPIPQPGPSQVQIQVTVAGLNPHDQKSRDIGLFVASHLPAVLANDVVGRVTSVGESVTQYAVGDRIVTQATFSPGSLQNGLQQYALADVDFSAKIPDSLSDDQAATLPTNIIAPLVAIFDASALNIPAPWTSAASSFDYAGTTLLIVGGGSGCGKFGVQLAALAKIGKIVVVGGDEAELKSYGATHVVSRFGDDDAVLASVRDIVGDDLLYAFDAVNAPSGQHLAANALSNTKRGAFARLIPRDAPEEAKVHPKQNGYDLKNVFGSSHARPEISKAFWELVPGYLKDGQIKPTKKFEVVEQGLDAEKVNGVLDRYRDGKGGQQTHFRVA